MQGSRKFLQTAAAGADSNHGRKPAHENTDMIRYGQGQMNTPLFVFLIRVSDRNPKFIQTVWASPNRDDVQRVLVNSRDLTQE
jgi:hypothetical protein